MNSSNMFLIFLKTSGEMRLLTYSLFQFVCLLLTLPSGQSILVLIFVCAWSALVESRPALKLTDMDGQLSIGIKEICLEVYE